MIIAQNKKALYEYTILDTFTAGIVLTGPEVKSVKRGQLSLVGGYIHLRHSELFLEGITIAPYGPAKREQRDYHTGSSRKLLLTHKEIQKVIGALKTPGTSAVPLKALLTNNWVKIEIAIVRGKKQYDKREAIKNRELQRKIDRALRKRQ